MQITKGTIQRALKVVVYGAEGIGKTTFASHFPRPLFIDTEHSTDFLDVDRLPVPSSWTMLLEEVQEAKKYVGQYLTLVVDTADWAEMLCKKHVCDSRGMKSIEDAGYGKGYVYLAEEWGKLLNALTELRDAGMNIVLTAHAMMRKFEQPDELGAYDRWEMKLEKKTAPMTKEWSDMILFANYETYVVKENKGAAKGKAQGGRRVMYTAHHPCWDAKNRQGLPDKLPFEFEQIAGCFSGVPAQAATTADTSTLSQYQEPDDNLPFTYHDGEAEPDQVTMAEVTEREAEPAPAPAENPSGSAVPPPAAETVPKALADLMEHDGVREDEVRSVIAAKGYYPADTPWHVMEREGFVDGWVIPFWKNIAEMVNDNRFKKSLPF